jgi:hypothetical protein
MTSGLPASPVTVVPSAFAKSRAVNAARFAKSTYRRLAPASGRVQRSYGVVSGRSPSERKWRPNSLDGGIARWSG